MKVVLGIPFRDDGRRKFFYDKVLERLPSLYPFDEVITEDSGHPIFNRAASRNLIAKKALEMEADVVVICDADSIPQDFALGAAIRESDDGRVHTPFDTVWVMPSSTARPGNASYMRRRPLYSYGPSCGGIFVVKPSQWIHIGGMDERIVGWGCEDEIFLAATVTFVGRPVHHPGILYNFHHTRISNTAYAVSNQSLRDQYNSLMGDHDAIRRLQAGSNCFCPESWATSSPE